MDDDNIVLNIVNIRPQQAQSRKRVKHRKPTSVRKVQLLLEGRRPENIARFVEKAKERKVKRIQTIAAAQASEQKETDNKSKIQENQPQVQKPAQNENTPKTPEKPKPKFKSSTVISTQKTSNVAPAQKNTVSPKQPLTKSPRNILEKVKTTQIQEPSQKEITQQKPEKSFFTLKQTPKTSNVKSPGKSGNEKLHSESNTHENSMDIDETTTKTADTVSKQIPKKSIPPKTSTSYKNAGDFFSGTNFQPTKPKNQRIDPSPVLKPDSSETTSKKRKREDDASISSLVDQLKSSSSTQPTKKSKTENGTDGMETDEPKEVKKHRYNNTFKPYDFDKIVRGVSVSKTYEKPQVNENEIFAKEESFESLGISPLLIKALKDNMEVTQPTIIQSSAIPHILNESDVLLKAATGSGKTLAYLLPVLHKLSQVTPRIDRAHGTQALIIAPTRELCLQIFKVFQKLTHKSSVYWLVGGTVMGGEKKKSEKARIRKGIPILIGTPGRILDHLQTTSSFKYDNLQFLILDEVDRLLDLGFEVQLQKIIKIINRTFRGNAQLEEYRYYEGRGNEDVRHEEKSNQGGLTIKHKILVSATLTEKIEKLANFALKKDRVFIDVSSDNEFTPKSLVQSYVVVPAKKRLITLAAFLRYQILKPQPTEGAGPPPKTIVFMSNIAAVEFIFALFSKATLGSAEDLLIPVPLFKLHGDLTQVERTSIYFKFSECRTSAVLFCTDVVARGLDLPAVNWIIQYDPPGEPSEYVHRAGRTARLGTFGEALLFLLPQEDQYVQLLETQFNVTLKKISTASVLRTLNETADVLNELVYEKEPELDENGEKVEGEGEEQIQEEIGSILQGKLEKLVEAEKPQLGKKIRGNRFEREKLIQLQKEEQEEAQAKSLYTMACDAYLSSVRAYATHPGTTKHIFHIGNLHLGQLARSFGLSEAPSKFRAWKNKKRDPYEKTERKRQRKEHLPGWDEGFELEGEDDDFAKNMHAERYRRKIVKKMDKGVKNVPKKPAFVSEFGAGI